MISKFETRGRSGASKDRTRPIGSPHRRFEQSVALARCGREELGTACGTRHYIQQRAAEQDSRVVTLPPWPLFSTQTGDDWLLEPGDHLAVPLARQRDPLPVYIEETDKIFTIAWLGTYRIEGQAFLYSEQNSGRIRTTLGYPIRHIADWILEFQIFLASS